MTLIRVVKNLNGKRKGQIFFFLMIRLFLKQKILNFIPFCSGFCVKCVCINFLFLCYLFFLFIIILNLLFLIFFCVFMTFTRMTKRSKQINSKILTLQTPFLGNSTYMINVSFEALFGKDVIPNFENRYNLTILCNHHFTIIFNTTHSKPSISPNLRTLQIRNSHARLSGSYNTKHCQDNTICLLAKKKTYCVTSPMFTFPIA